MVRENTGLDEGLVRALSKGDLALGMSKKASWRFCSMFSVLGRKQQIIDASNGLLWIPSPGSLLLDPMDKSERERMMGHLDTQSYAEGIMI